MPMCQGKTKSGNTCCRTMKDGVTHCHQHKHHHAQQQPSPPSGKSKSFLKGTRDVTYQTGKLPGTVVSKVLPRPRRSGGIYSGTRNVAVGAAELPGKLIYDVLY